MWTYLTTARDGRMTPLERTVLFSIVVVPVGLLGPFFSTNTGPERLTHVDGIFLILAVAATAACSELRWWVRLFVIGVFAGMLQIGASYVALRPHALQTGFLISCLVTNGIDALSCGRTDLPGFYREWAAAARSAIWRRLRWAAYYVVSFVVIITFSVCTTYWIELSVSTFAPSLAISSSEDWLDYSILAMLAVFAILMIGRRFPKLGARVRLVQPGLWAVAASTALMAAMQAQLLYFHHMGLKTGEWQTAVIKETAADWAPGILNGLSVSAALIIGVSVVLVPAFILVTALSDRAKAEGGSSRLAAILSGLGLVFFCASLTALLGSVLLGTLRGTPDAAGLGNIIGWVIGFVGSLGWLIWRRAFGPTLLGNLGSPNPARYATGVTELPADVAAAVDAARSPAAPR